MIGRRITTAAVLTVAMLAGSAASASMAGQDHTRYRTAKDYAPNGIHTLSVRSECLAAEDSAAVLTLVAYRPHAGIVRYRCGRP